MKMADSGIETIYCGPCEYENVTKLAAKWCSDCEDGYCDVCLRLHKAVKLSRNHHLVKVSEYQKVQQLIIPRVCLSHQKNFEYFCPGHDSVICILCVQAEHGQCSDLLSLQNAAKEAKTSTALTDLEQNIDNLLDNIENGMKIHDTNLKSIQDSEIDINLAVRAKHEKIIQYYKRLQDKALVELTATYTQCQQEILSSKSTFMKKQKHLRNVKDRILQMKTCLSDVQAFVGIKMMTGSMQEEKEAVKLLVNDVSSLVLKFEPNENIQIRKENTKTYGTTTVAASKSSVSFFEPKVVQAQIKIPSLNSGLSIQLQLRRKFNINWALKQEDKLCDISSCLILPNKQIMILNQTKQCLVIYNENGSYYRNIKVAYPPYDAAVTDDRTVAVTFTGARNIISIVDYKSNRLIRNIENAVNKWCWGISHNDGKLYVRSYREGINVIDLYGRIIKRIPETFANVFKLISTSKNVIYTDNEGSLCCLDMDGNQLWSFTSSLLKHSSDSASITADEKGNIYAVGEQSNVLIAVSKDGKNQKVLLNEQSGLENPNAVYYSQENKLLLICNERNGHAALYDVRL